MNITRYFGMSTYDDVVIDKIFGGELKVNPNDTVKNCTIIPIDNKKAVYQLGWSSVVLFQLKDGKFDSFNIKYSKYSAANAIPPRDKEIYTVSTRGVNSCTAVAVRRGDRMCLMNLDRSDLNAVKAEFDNIFSYLAESDGIVHIWGSYANEENVAEEKLFVEEFIDNCSKKFGKAALKKGAIDRGSTKQNQYMRHIEFGIALDRDANDPAVFGDILSGDKKCGLFEIPLG